MSNIIYSFLIMVGGLVILFFIILSLTNRSTFVLVNKTQCDWVDVRVSIGKETVWGGEIEMGYEVSGSFNPFYESAFNVDAMCGVTTIHKEKIGYIRMWQGFDHKITVNEDMSILYEILTPLPLLSSDSGG